MSGRGKKIGGPTSKERKNENKIVPANPPEKKAENLSPTIPPKIVAVKGQPAVNSFVDYSDETADIDMSVLSFAHWLTEVKRQSNDRLNQLAADISAIDYTITMHNTDLTEFKRNSSIVQQQMQNQVVVVRDKLNEAFTKLTNMVKSKVHFQQEVEAEYQGLAEQLQFKTLEIETLKKAYADANDNLNNQIIVLKEELTSTKQRLDAQQKSNDVTHEHDLNKIAMVELGMHSTHQEVEKMRDDHSKSFDTIDNQAGALTAEVEKLQKELKNFQTIVHSSNLKLQTSMWNIQKYQGNEPGAPQQSPRAASQQSLYGHPRGAPHQAPHSNYALPNSSANSGTLDRMLSAPHQLPHQYQTISQTIPRSIGQKSPSPTYQPAMGHRLGSARSVGSSNQAVSPVSPASQPMLQPSASMGYNKPYSRNSFTNSVLPPATQNYQPNSMYRRSVSNMPMPVSTPQSQARSPVSSYHPEIQKYQSSHSGGTLTGHVVSTSMNQLGRAIYQR
eukprot:Platyproteum_vivax@DN6575_c0_g1_i2.p1